MTMLERLLSASISSAERDKVAKALRDAHETVVRTNTERWAKQYGAESMVAEEEHVKALEAFHSLAVIALDLSQS